MGVFVGLDGTPEAVLVALAPWRDSLDRVALEAGPTSEWIGGRLVEAGVPADGGVEVLVSQKDVAAMRVEHYANPIAQKLRRRADRL